MRASFVNLRPVISAPTNHRGEQRAGRARVPGILASILPLALAGALHTPVAAQSSRIAAIEVFGARTLSPDEVKRASGLSEGGTIPENPVDVEERIRRLPGVTAADASVVCCEAGRSVVYLGIQEGEAPFRPRPAPTGFVAMPDEVLRAEEEFSAALRDAVERGQAEEDHSRGHALMKDPRARAAQERFIDLARRYGDSLRSVLRESRFPLQRALAAQVLGYLPDKAHAIDALGPALSDASAAVRNDAARALWIIASYAGDDAELRARIPVEPLIRMLHSVEWTDRNKASLVLMALTAARDSTLLALLSGGAREELEEMAAWRTQHGLAPFVILGRIDGRGDGEIFAAWRARPTG